MRVPILVGIGAVWGGLLGLAVLAAPFLPPQASEQADRFGALWAYLIIVSGVIFGIVVTVLSYAVMHFRGRHGDMRDGPPIHGITWLEITWTATPFALVISIIVFSWIILNRNDPSTGKNNQNVPAQRGQLTVDVLGYQYGWKYTIQSMGVKDVDQLQVPNRRPIYFRIHGKDVIHSFWVPEWRIQMESVPGRVNTVAATPTREGSYPVICAFLCGPGHPQMNPEVTGGLVQPIRVVSESAFRTWAAKAQKA